MSIVGAIGSALRTISNPGVMGLFQSFLSEQNRQKQQENVPDVPNTQQVAPHTQEYLRPRDARILGTDTTLQTRIGPQELAKQQMEDQAAALRGRDQAIAQWENFVRTNQEQAQALAARGAQNTTAALAEARMGKQQSLGAIEQARQAATPALAGQLGAVQTGIESIRNDFKAALNTFKTDFSGMVDSIKLDVADKMAQQATAIQQATFAAMEDAEANIAAAPGDAQYKRNLSIATREKIGMQGAQQMNNTLREFNQEMVQYLGDVKTKGMEMQTSMMNQYLSSYSAAVTEGTRVAAGAWQNWGAVQAASADAIRMLNTDYANTQATIRSNDNWIQSTATQLAMQGDILGAQNLAMLRQIQPAIAPIMEAQMAYLLSEQDLEYNREQANWAVTSGIDNQALANMLAITNNMVEYRFAYDQIRAQERMNERALNFGMASSGTEALAGFGGDMYTANALAQA